MIDFVVRTLRRREVAGGGGSRLTLSDRVEDLTRSRPYPTDDFFCWTSSDERVQVVVLHSSLPPFLDLKDVVTTSHDGSISLFFGHALSGTQLVRSVEHWLSLGAPQEMQGDYIAWRLDAKGHGRIHRPPVSMMQLYRTSDEAADVVASRVSLAARTVGRAVNRIDPNFLRWVAGYAIAGNDSTLIEGVEMVRMDRQPQLSENGMEFHSRLMSEYCDPVLQAEYQRDPNQYWDDTFDRLCLSIKTLDLTDDPIEFPLSGGRDSRLLLGLVRKVAGTNRFRRVFTNGPPISPEVRSARLVCEALGLAHEHVDHSSVVRPTAFPVTSRLPIHLAITEGEMTPIDLTFQVRRTARTQLNGQEGGLRNIAGRATLADRQQTVNWFRRHLADGDPLGLLRQEAAASSMAEVDALLEEFANAEVPYADWPSLHRVLYRLSRWVGRTWKNYNSIMFAPYMFTTTDVVRRTLSAGAESRSLEEFHFQMLWRLDKRLIEMPFAGQRWDDALFAAGSTTLVNPAPLSWPEGTTPHAVRPMLDATVRHWPLILGFLRQDQAWLSEVMDWDKLERLTPETINVVMYQRLWQVLQCSLARRHLDWDHIDSAPAIAAALPDLDLA